MNKNVKPIFEALLSHLETFDKIEVSYLKTCVQVKKGSTVLSISKKKDCLELEFQLDREDDFFPVFKCQRISKNRILHRVALGELSDFDQQIKIWIKDTYQLIK